ncbi:MAG: glutathione S-transferase [Rhodospirillales bacterium 20-60-12]|nr:MAG: glutathione S-transferase [Rhodospirillales bacterium 20-60-12]HQT66177.1 glutathione S-transferase [Acetobacteraceae bacterium]HQU01178.1 glutathione S-transferase [Acetobacteraceae bacterium]
MAKAVNVKQVPLKATPTSSVSEFETDKLRSKPAKLLISSRNYSSWSLRGFLLARLSGINFVTESAALDDPRARAELLMRASSILLPCLVHDGFSVWDTLAIAEYLNELMPEAQMMPRDLAARARCRSISGEIHSGFSALRSSLPMNLRLHRKGFTVWSSAQADIDRVLSIWRECLNTWHGPYLFGEKPTVADAMYAPVVTRLLSYDVSVDETGHRYCETIMAWPDMQEWIEAALQEPEEITELDLDF